MYACSSLTLNTFGIFKHLLISCPNAFIRIFDSVDGSESTAVLLGRECAVPSEDHRYTIIINHYTWNKIKTIPEKGVIEPTQHYEQLLLLTFTFVN